MIEKAFNLSHIPLLDDDKKTVSDQLDKVIILLDQIKEVKTDGIEPLIHPIPNAYLNFCDDATKNTDTDAEAVLSNAPRKKYNYFIVPKIIS